MRWQWNGGSPGRSKLEGLLRISSADWFLVAMSCRRSSLPPRAAYPDVLIELFDRHRLFSLSHREADLVFRVVPFAEPDVVQRRFVTMRYGVYVRRDRVNPVIGDGSGFQLITMDASLGSFPDTAWLVDRFPNASVGLRSNSRHVQAHLCEEDWVLRSLPRPVGDRRVGLRRLELPDDPPNARSGWGITAICARRSDVCAPLSTWLYQHFRIERRRVRPPDDAAAETDVEIRLARLSKDVPSGGHQDPQDAVRLPGDVPSIVPVLRLALDGYA